MKFSIILMLLLASCKVGPNYKKPEMNIPDRFSESGADWEVANPSDIKDRGDWWKIFKDPELDKLVEKLNQNNQSIKSSLSSYNEALALVSKARISYLPSITSSASIIRERQLTNSSPVKTSTTSNNSLLLNASWEPDLWGNVARSVESSSASAESAKALLASTVLSSQASLAQYYFELRMIDKNQEILDKIVSANQAILAYNKNRYLSGVAGEQAVVQSEKTLQAAKILFQNNQITRAQYGHAIAVLIGEFPSNFRMEKYTKMRLTDISVPISLPSTILERRPDVASAERQVAIASAQIGVTRSAFFPNLTISALGTLEGKGKNLVSLPVFLWSVGPELALNISNLAAYRSANLAAKENYNRSAANYRNTVLAAFQDVEDNLVAFRILNDQVKIQKLAESSTKRNLEITRNQFKAGIIDRSQLANAEIAYYNAEKILNEAYGLRATTSVALIKALGGGFL